MPTIITSKPPLIDKWKAGDYKASGLQKILFESFDSLRYLEQCSLRVQYPDWFGRDEYTASVNIFCPGDRSVGIQPFSYSMTIHRDLIEGKEDRENLRKEISDFYSDICDGFRRIVTFDDEGENDDC